MTRFLIHLIKTHTKELAQKIFKQAKTLMKLYPYNAHATKDGEYITAQFWSSETCIRKLLKTGYDLTIQWGAQCYAIEKVEKTQSVPARGASLPSTQMEHLSLA